MGTYVKINGTWKAINSSSIKRNGAWTSGDKLYAKINNTWKVAWQNLQTFSIVTTVNSGTFSGSTSIIEGGTATVTISANTGYTLPSSISVSGATYSYNSSTGVISLSNPTNNVVISATCIEKVINYLCFSANSTNSTIKLSVTGTPTKGQSFEYSTNKTSWSTYTVGNTITLSNTGDKVYFRGNNTTLSESVSVYYQFTISGSVAGSGSIMSLLDKTDTLRDLSNTYYCFCYLFYNCTSLTTTPLLPATTLGEGCYYRMFALCTSLTAMPTLSATVLANTCYYKMFDACTSLVTIMTLPAINLTEYCYGGMFRDCKSLTTPLALPATTLVEGCYYIMFEGCTKLKINSQGTYLWRVPISGTGTDAHDALEEMLYNTGGTIRWPSINTTYYCDYQPI